MIEVSVSKVKADFSKYLNRAAYGQERVIITSRGKPKAVLLSFEELERLETLEDALATQEIKTRNQRAIEMLQAWAAEPDDTDDAWWDEFERELAENRLTFREFEFDLYQAH